MSLLVGARELWWTSRELSPAGIIIIIIIIIIATLGFHVHISPGG
jgi:hypothetical protein